MTVLWGKRLAARECDPRAARVGKPDRVHVRGELANSPSKLTLWVIERARGFLEHWRAAVRGATSDLRGE
jgi:hypothetical protein